MLLSHPYHRFHCGDDSLLPLINASRCLRVASAVKRKWLQKARPQTTRLSSQAQRVTHCRFWAKVSVYWPVNVWVEERERFYARTSTSTLESNCFSRGSRKHRRGSSCLLKLRRASPGCQVPVDEPPLLQVGHATGHLHGVLAQGVDEHGPLRTNAAQTLQQGAQRGQLRHLHSRGHRGETQGEQREEELMTLQAPSSWHTSGDTAMANPCIHVLYSI